MTDKILIQTEEDWMSEVKLCDNSDLMYLLSSLKAGSTVKVVITNPTLYCKIEIFETEKEVIE